ncbi:MAG TPA: MFS transporter [Chloroflexota bacterium]|jgi:MFS family permease|nr:MFS transporter [Chloroflexota bacterium]
MGEAAVGGAAARAEPAGWRKTFASLRHPDFALMMAGTLPGTLAMQMGMVAFGYLAYEISGSATALGLIGLAWGIPMLFLSLIGGVVADRVPRRTILIVTQGTIGCAAVVNALLLYGGKLQLWHLYAVALVQGTAFAFNMPARQAMSAELVGKEDLSNAMALFNANMNLTRVVGPAIAGLLIALPQVGVSGVFGLMAAAYVLVILTFWRIRGGRTRAGANRGSGLQQLQEGLSYIRSNRKLIMLLTLGFLPMMLGMPYQLLMPVFALGVLRVGPEGLGMLNAASGIGALLGSLALASLGNFGGKARLQSITGIAFGLSLLGFALAPSYAAALLILPALGAASSAYMALNNTLVMENTPRQFYGRVMSVYMMTFSLMPLASVPFARLADEIGARPTLAAAGALLAYLVAVIAFGGRLRLRAKEPVRTA